MKKTSSLFLGVVLLALFSCSSEDSKREETSDAGKLLSEAFDHLFEEVQPPREERRIDMKLGEHTLNGGIENSPDQVRVVRTDTVIILTDEQNLQKITEVIKGFSILLSDAGFTVNYPDQTTDQMPEPQYFEAALKKGSLEGFCLLTVSPPLNGYLTITAVAQLNRKR